MAEPIQLTVETQVLGSQVLETVDNVIDSIEREIDRMVTAGMSEAAIKETVLKSLENEGRLFSPLKTGLKKSVKSSVNGVALQASVATQQQAGATEFTWVTISKDPCPDCVERGGQTGTMDYWRNVGLPKSGFSVCGHNCKCRLVRSDKKPPEKVIREEPKPTKPKPKSTVPLNRFGDKDYKGVESSKTRTAYLDDDTNFNPTRNGHDEFVEGVAKEKGFHKKPAKVVDYDDFEDIYENDPNYIIMYRGVTERGFKDQFVKGDYWAGTGIYGNGTYCSNLYRTAKQYTRARSDDIVPQRLTKIALPKNAKIIGDRELDRIYIKVQQHYEDLMNKKTFDLREKLHKLRIPEGASEAVEKQIKFEYRRLQLEIDKITAYYRKVKDLYKDEGRLAIELGYDAIKIPTQRQIKGGEDYYVLLNRGILHVSE